MNARRETSAQSRPVESMTREMGPGGELSSLHQITVITRLTFREARRRKLLWLGLGLGIVFVALFTVGFYFAHQDWLRYSPRAQIGFVDLFANTFLMAGLYVVNFLVIMVTVLTAVGTLSAEIDSNTIHAVAAKPIRRWEIVLGKWIGHALLLALYTLVMAVGLVGSVYIISGYLPPNILTGVAILLLESLTTLSITMLGSSRLSTLANGVVVFMLYGVGFVGGWVEQIGSLLDSQTAIDIGVASSLFMPSEALWRYASGIMQPTNPLALGVNPFSVTSQPTPAFIVYAVVYLLAALAATMVLFTRRDV